MVENSSEVKPDAGEQSKTTSIIILVVAGVSIFQMIAQGIVLWLYTNSPNAVSPFLVINSICLPLPLLVAAGLSISSFIRQKENRTTLIIMSLVISLGLLILSCLLLALTIFIVVSVVALY